MIDLLLWTLLGAVVASLLAMVPALHIHNVAGLFLLLMKSGRVQLAPEATGFLFLGLVTGYTMGNTIPSIFLSAPDESMIFVVLPGQKYMLQRRGFEVVTLKGLGGLGGLLVIVVLVPVASHVLPPLRQILQPHVGWILWTTVVYLLLSGWPKGTERAPAGWARWWDGWRSLTAGLATFLLSGLLGMVLMYRSPVHLTVAYQNMLPAFVGLFAVPWIIQNLATHLELPPQHVPRDIALSRSALLQGSLAGAASGLFAAFFPVVTSGIGGLLAGHATAQRDERAFLITQGAAKMTHVGGFLLLFVPGLHLTRGGMAWMPSTRYTSYTPERYIQMTAGALLAGVSSFLLSLALARGLMWVLSRVSYRAISWGTRGVLAVIVGSMTGLAGLAICAVATGIGLIPVLWGSRRTNAMGFCSCPSR